MRQISRPIPKNKVSITVLLNFGDGRSLQTRFVWSVRIKEVEAVKQILQRVPTADLSQLAQIVITQSTTHQRITWLDQPPKGIYFFNQHTFGTEAQEEEEGLIEAIAAPVYGLKQQPPTQQREMQYDPNSF